jgi:tape measure domain-containing protein
MSRTIDSRVVEMQFDNKQFESNVKATMSTLDKLKQSLNLTGSYDSMSGLSGTVESVSMKFSALEVIAVTALANITNSAINAGKRIVSALTIDPIKTGFSEYETKINAIQTIMSNTASKGTTMEDITRVIDELNTYADKTIYNFAEMTRNIGTFTAAGVGLEESAKAIQGIANLAAASGSSSQQASTAMYQLSQAIAAGTVKLMDWNSVVNAGMGGEKFQEALKQTAREYGINVDQIIEKNGSFRDSLHEGWLSAEILNQTLSKFTVEGATKYAKSMMESGKWTQEQADALIAEAQAMEDAATKVKTFTQLWDTLKESAQSGWGKSWELIIGDFEEAKVLLTEISNVFGGLIDKSADARNEMLQFWKDNGGRAALIDSFRNSFEALGRILKPIGEAFREIFPSITGAQLVSITEGLKNFTEALKIGDETAKNIKDTFKGFFALLDIGKMALTAIAGGLISLVKALFPVTGNFLSVTGGVGDFIVAIRDALKSSDTFNVAIQNIGKVLKPVAEGIVMFTDLIANAFKAVRTPDLTGIDEFTGQIEKRFQPLIKLGEAFKSFLSFFYNLASTIGEILSKLSDSIFKSLNDANFNSIFDFINSGLFAAILYGIKKFIDSLTKITDSAGGFLSGITGIFDGVRGCLEAYQSNLKANVLLKIAISIGILAAALLTISMIDSEKLTVSLGAMTIMFVELFAAMSAFSTLTGPRGFLAMTQITTGMIGLSVAVLILASAMQKLGNLDWDGVIKGLVGIAGLSVILIKVSKALETSSKSLISASVGFIVFGAAILILTQAVKQLGGLDLADLAKGLVGVGVLMAELVLFMKVADLSGMGAIKSVGILLLAAAITVLAGAVKKLSSINLGDLVKGLSGLAVMLASIAIFINVAGNAKKVIATAASLTILGVAMNIFAAAIIKMGGMSWEEMSRGLISLGSALAIVTLALMALPNGIFIKSLALMDVAGAMLLLSQTLKAFSSMSWEEIAKSLTALIVSLGVIIGAFVLLSKTSSVVDSLAFSVLSLSIVMLAGALKTIGSMSLAQIGIALIGLAGAFTVIGVAATLLTPAIPAILGLAAAIALLGVGVAAIGGGILALSAGLSALAVAGTAGTVALVALVTALIGLIPSAAKTLALGVIEFARVLGAGAPIIKDAFLVLLASALEAFTEAIPMITEAVFTLLISLLDALVKYTPDVVERVFDFLIGILNAIAKKLPQLIQAGVDVLMAFFSGVIDALSGIDVEVLLKGIAGIGLLSAIMIALAAVASLVPAAMVGVLGMGVVIAELALVLAAIGELAQIPGLKWLINEGAELMQGVGNAIGSFIGGIVGGFMSGVSSNFPKIGSDLSAFMTNIQPFIEGAKSIDASTMDGVKALAETILILTAANILEGLTSWFTGGSSMTKFGKELAEFGPYFKNYYESIKGIDGSVVESSANAAKSLAEFAKEIPNSGGVVGWFAGENSLSAFAEELMEFGPKLKSYADSVKGLDASVVINSANAAKALAEMATNLPNSGGVVGWFTGENSLSVFAEELMDFGPKLKAYADSVRGLDSNVVVNSANAAKALAELSTNLPNTGGIVSWFTGDNDIASFGEQLVSFGQSFASYYASVSTVNTAQLSGVVTEFKNLVDLANGIKSVDTSGMSTFSQNLTALGNAGIDGFINAFTNANSRVSAAATTMLTTFINSANAKKAKLTTTFNNIVQAVITTINEKQKLFQTAGNTLMVKFIDGIRSKDATVSATFTQIISGCLTKIKNKYTDFYNVGKYLVEGFAAGITKNTYLAEAKAQAMAAAAIQAAEKELGIHSPSKEFIYLGQHIGDGLAIGINNSIDKATKSSSKLAEEIIKYSKKSIEEFQSWVEDKKYYNEISLKEELDAWTLVQQRYKEGTEERKKADKEVYRLQKELVKATYQYSIDWIEKEKYYNRLSLKEELEAWQRVQSRYMEGSEERKKADKEVYRLQKELVKATYQYSIDWIEKEKYYNRLSLKEELEAWQRVQSRYMEGSEERKKADREVYRLQKELTDKKISLEKEYADTVKSINDDLKRDIQSLNDDYQNALKSRADAIYRSYGLFDKVSAPKRVSSDKLIKNLDEQVDSLNTWKDTLDDLSKRGLDPKLIEELCEMGPSVLGELTAISNMTDEQLSKYSDLWREKHRLAKNQATAELEKMRIKTDRQIKQLKIEAEAKLAEYTKVWKTRMAELLGIVLSTNTNIVTSTNDTMNDSIETINSKQVAYNLAGQNVASNLVAGVESKDTAVSNTFIQIISGALTTIKNKYTDFYNVGEYLVEGFAAGISSKTYRAEAKARAMASAAARAAERELDEHSPSRVFYGIGDNAGLGFINALSDYESKSYKAGSEMAESAKNGLSKAISKITDIINSDIDTQPTIRPVLDLSAITSGADKINGLFSSKRSIELAGKTGMGMNNLASNNQSNIILDNDNVVKAIGELRNDMSVLANTMSKLKIVMDTGTLVGALIGPLDSSFGQRVIYEGRGI